MCTSLIIGILYFRQIIEIVLYLQRWDICFGTHVTKWLKGSDKSAERGTCVSRILLEYV